MPTPFRRRVFRRALASMFALCMIVGAAPAWAFQFVPTEKEFYVYPAYCQAKLSSFLKKQPHLRHGLQLMPPAEITRWEQMVGPDFFHLHHYCKGLSLLSRALDPMTSRRERARHFRFAAQEIHYTWSRSKPGAPLWYEMSLKLARAYEGNGRRDRANEIYKDLLGGYSDKPDAWTEYAAFLKRRGELNDAIAVLEEGLSKTSSEGPLLFWLANYYFQLGDFEQAEATAERAEAAGMKVDRLKRRLGQL